ncbi:phytoene desaturase family protein [Nannocystis sp. bb15-2]|uniref:Phytoene desaturase family protein n=2 Tax=Nannocystis bainbridge TaxID=2995303 RepID=A0ABT5E996_9BACT|nr:1-hydroxycarotenoid 3,4-desaturase CrtD [Nannocystis bainbridge]MDC0721336.1 phytoene desaturase family protein [Nannocystis bainbridge]
MMVAKHSPRVVVIGGGAGGLAAAVDCARRGAAVLLLERGTEVGGKVRQEWVGGQPVDAGPTVLTMRWVFEALFADADDALADHVHLQALSVLARHAWQDGERLDLYADREATAAAISRFASAADASGYLAFCRHTEAIYQKVQGPFIRAAQPTLTSLVGSLGLRGLPGALGLDFHRTMWKSLGDYFRDPRLRQLFARYATYYGSSPFEAPATLNLIAHVEQTGVWAPVGGMSALTGAVAELARRHGAEIRCEAEVAAIEADSCVRAVRLASGERVPAEAVIFAGDLAALGDGRLGPAAARAVKAPPRSRRSLSAVTWCLRGQTGGWPLAYHNVLFSRDYAAEFTALMDRGALPAEPTVYVCAPDRQGDGVPVAGERLFVLVNAPPRGGEGWLTAREIEACERATWRVIERCGLSMAPAEPPRVTTPDDFAARFPGSGGGLYGTATRGLLDALGRPTATTKLPGLYVAGGSVHPGAGVPMATLSGRFAAATACAGLCSTGWSLRAATAGGTSTRSATTAATD